MAFFRQRNGVGIAGQAIELVTKTAGEIFQLVQGSRGLEGLSIQFDSGVGGVDAGAAVGQLLGMSDKGALSVP